MPDSRSKELEDSLGKATIHNSWEGDYRTDENEAFFERAFDDLVRFLGAPAGSKWLDAGCGACPNAIRLARRGFSVTASDFSEHVLENGRGFVEKAGLQDRIQTQRENILDLSFEDGCFDYILCWGVLMHIADLEKAISELSRVLAPGGSIVISEANMFSVQATLPIVSLFMKSWKSVLKGNKLLPNKTQAGIEFWEDTPSGKLVTRQANVGWLIKQFKAEGLQLKRRVAGQFTERYIYARTPRAKHAIHRLNEYWFRFVKLPYPAYGNIIIMKKPKS